jgi:hypothetical protein
MSDLDSYSTAFANRLIAILRGSAGASVQTTDSALS